MKFAIERTLYVFLCITCMYSALCNSYYHNSRVEDREYWYRVGNYELRSSFHVWLNNNPARNVIIFVGDGMDPNTVTATRIYKEKEQGKLSFENFPHIGVLKTYSVDTQVPDSAASATALFTGIKTNNGIIGLDATVTSNDCTSSMSGNAKLQSIMQWAQDAGKDTGFVTTSRITHATPAALYAYSPSRHWECDGTLPPQSLCKDIARQLIEDEPGRNFKVIFGGGRQCLIPNAMQTTEDKVDIYACDRRDGRDLIQQWMADKRARRARVQYIQNAENLHMLDTANLDYVLGVFSHSHMAMEHNRINNFRHQPSLMNMTEVAIHMLRKNRNGFFLMVESGLIDSAHHEGHAREAIEETAHFDDTIRSSLDLLMRHDLLNDTLVIVTGDHGHTLSINGYPKRGSDIFGIAQRSKHDNIPYTTLTYSTGKKNSYHYDREGNRINPLDSDILSRNYAQQAAILTDEETHGGGDILVYAQGPRAHLFHNVHEQTFVANVISYAANVGPYRLNSATKLSTSLPLIIPFMASLFYGLMA